MKYSNIRNRTRFSIRLILFAQLAIAFSIGLRSYLLVTPKSVIDYRDSVQAFASKGSSRREVRIAVKKLLGTNSFSVESIVISDLNYDVFQLPNGHELVAYYSMSEDIRFIGTLKFNLDKSVRSISGNPDFKFVDWQCKQRIKQSKQSYTDRLLADYLFRTVRDNFRTWPLEVHARNIASIAVPGSESKRA